MKSAPLILSIIAGGLAVINLIWPHNALISTAVLLVAVAICIKDQG